MRGNVEQYLARAEKIKGFVKDERDGECYADFTLIIFVLQYMVLYCVTYLCTSMYAKCTYIVAIEHVYMCSSVWLCVYTTHSRTVYSH